MSNFVIVINKGKFKSLFHSGILVPFIFSLIFVWGILSTSSVSAQGNKKKTQIPDSFEIHKMLIIPFSTDMYFSDADQYILQESEMNSKQLVKYYRSALASALRGRSPGWWETEVMGKEQNDLHLEELVEVSVGYTYEAINSQTSGAKKPPVVKPTDQRQIYQGQVKVEEYNTPSFMNVKIKNDTLLSFLSSYFKTDLFLFVNQLDVKSDLSSYAAMDSATYTRTIQVHYSIIRKNGKQFFSGLATQKFPSNINDAHRIATDYFPLVAAKITENLPGPEKIKKVKPKGAKDEAADKEPEIPAK